MTSKAIEIFMGQYKLLVGVLNQAQTQIYSITDELRTEKNALCVDAGYAALAIDIAIIAAEFLKDVVEKYEEVGAATRASVARTQLRNALALAGHLIEKLLPMDMLKSEREALESAQIYLRVAEKVIYDFPLTAIFGYSKFGGA